MFVANTNVLSMTAMRAQAQSESRMQRTLEKLSSGLRINSARDDAAGLAISNRFTTQIRGMNQAVRNVNDAVSLMQTAEGSLGEITGLLQRGRELAIRAANATVSRQDRESLQSEINQIFSEVDRISSSTTFNSVKLFADTSTGATYVDAETGSGVRLDVWDEATRNVEEREAILASLQRGWLQQSEQLLSTYLGLDASNATLRIYLDDQIDFADAFVSFSGSTPGPHSELELHIGVQNLMDVADALNIDVGTYPQDTFDQLIAHEMTHAVMAATLNVNNYPTWFMEGTAEFIPGGDFRLDSVIDGGATPAQVASALATIDSSGFNGSHLHYASSYSAVRYLHDRIKDAGGGGIEDMMAYLRDDAGRTLDDYFAQAGLTRSDDVTAIGSEAAFISSFATVDGAGYIGGLNLSNNDTGGIGGSDADGGGRDTTYAGAVPDTDSLTTDPLAGFIEVYPYDQAEKRLQLSMAAHFQFHVGAEAGQTIQVQTRGISSTGLGLDNVDLVTNANGSLVYFDAALNAIDQERGRLGAVQNRLDIASSSLQMSSENASASRSRILDTDYAAETMELTRRNILMQASTAALVQANGVPQLILSLLQGI